MENGQGIKIKRRGKQPPASCALFNPCNYSAVPNLQAIRPPRIGGDTAEQLLAAGDANFQHLPEYLPIP